MPADRDSLGDGAHEWNCRRDCGAELRSEATRSEATNHKTVEIGPLSILYRRPVSSDVMIERLYYTYRRPVSYLSVSLVF